MSYSYIEPDEASTVPSVTSPRQSGDLARNEQIIPLVAGGGREERAGGGCQREQLGCQGKQFAMSARTVELVRKQKILS